MKKKIEHCYLVRDPHGYILGSGDDEYEALYEAALELPDVDCLNKCTLCYTRLEHIFTDDGEYVRTDDFAETHIGITTN